MAFFELNVAVTGLFAAQRGMGVVGNNITNANTKGYSRQILNQRASDPLSGLGVGMTGTGVETTGVNRVRDIYLDNKYWTQNAGLGQYNVKVTQNSLIESVFGEPNDAGYTKVYDKLFSAISTMQNNPSSNDSKIAFRGAVIGFTEYYNNIAASLKAYQQDANYSIKSTVMEINSLANRIQSLNNQIYQVEINGNEASSFRDERDLCIDRLSEIVNVETEETTEVVATGNTVSRYTVKIAGQTLVDHLRVNNLGIKVRGKAEEVINTYSTEMKTLNEKCLAGTATDAEKKRMDEIAGYMYDQGAGTTKAANGTYSIRYNGQDALSTSNVRKELEYKKLNEEDIDGLYDIVWENGLSFNMADANMSGELKGLIDVRDGNGTANNNNGVTYNGIPYYIRRLNQYVRTFAEQMNDAYSSQEDGSILVTAYKADGSVDGDIKSIEKDAYGNVTAYTKADGSKVTGSLPTGYSYQSKYQIFTYKTGNASGEPIADADLKDGYKNVTAENFSISKEIFDNFANIRGTYDAENKSDGRLFGTLAAQKDNIHMFKEGDPKDYMISIFSELGINSEESQLYQATQKSVTKTIQNQRLQVSQVDSSEEFVNLIKYQQAYQAAAKVMNTIDGIYETTIFRLGNF